MICCQNGIGGMEAKLENILTQKCNGNAFLGIRQEYFDILLVLESVNV